MGPWRRPTPPPNPFILRFLKNKNKSGLHALKVKGNNRENAPEQLRSLCIDTCQVLIFGCRESSPIIPVMLSDIFSVIVLIHSSCVRTMPASTVWCCYLNTGPEVRIRFWTRMCVKIGAVQMPHVIHSVYVGKFWKRLQLTGSGSGVAELQRLRDSTD